MLSDNKLNEIGERLQNADGTRIYDAVNKSAITTMGDDYFVEHATDDVRLLLNDAHELRAELLAQTQRADVLRKENATLKAQVVSMGIELAIRAEFDDLTQEGK